MPRQSALKTLAGYAEREFVNGGTDEGMTAPFRRDFTGHRHTNEMWKDACDFMMETDQDIAGWQTDISAKATELRNAVNVGVEYAKEYIGQAREFLDAVLWFEPCRIMDRIDASIMRLQAAYYILQNYTQDLARRLYLEFEDFNLGGLRAIIIAQLMLIDRWIMSVVESAKALWNSMVNIYNSLTSAPDINAMARTCSKDFLDVMEGAIRRQDFQVTNLITGTESLTNLALASLRRKIALIHEVKRAKNAWDSAIAQLEAAKDELEKIVPTKEQYERAFNWND